LGTRENVSARGGKIRGGTVLMDAEVGGVS